MMITAQPISTFFYDIPASCLMLDPDPVDITYIDYQATRGNQQHISDMNRESLRTLQAENRMGTPGSQPTWGQRENGSMPRCHGVGPQYAPFCEKRSVGAWATVLFDCCGGRDSRSRAGQSAENSPQWGENSPKVPTSKHQIRHRH